VSDRRAAALRRYLEIVHTLARREFVVRYRGNLLGAFTAVLVPLLFLVTYTFVFSTLVPVRLQPDATRADYAFFFFAGLVGWTLFAETTTRAPRLFASQAHFVRRSLFPVSALPVASSLSAFYHSLLWLAVFALARALSGGPLPASLVLAPVLLALLALLTAGIALVVAALGAFVRDLGEWIGPLLSVGLFLSPILYPAERIAAVAPWLVALNPLAPLIESLRGVLLHGSLPGPSALAALVLWPAALLGVGVLVHRRFRPLLADVL
jgi:lipopolysaccharide transport system permease protein